MTRAPAARAALIGLAVSLSAGLSFTLGRWSVDDEASAARPSAGAPSAPGRAARATAAPLRPEPPTAGLEPSAAVAAPEAAGQAEADPARAASAALEASLQALRAAAAAPDDAHAAEAAEAAAGVLERALLDDPRVLQAALERFPRCQDEVELGLLAALLARVRDPEVEQLALEQARLASSPARRAAAFDLLDGLDTPLARPAALEALRREPELAVRRAAVHALPEPVGATLEQADEVARALVALLEGDPDPETRRRAALKLASWRRDLEDLRALTRALAGDPSPDVRAGCAFGLEVAGDKAAEVRRALCARLQAGDEDPFVRETAWRALGRLGPLDPGEHELYEAFRREWEAAGEAGGGSDVAAR